MNSSGIVIALTSAGVGAFTASAVWAAAWQLRIERAAQAAEQQVFDAAAQQLTKVIGRARVPVYDVWERSALAGAEAADTVAMQVGEVAVPPAPAPVPVPVPSVAGTVLVLVQYLGQEVARWVHVRVVRLIGLRSQRRMPEHRGWDTPDDLAELQRLSGTTVSGRHHGQHRATEPVGVSR